MVLNHGTGVRFPVPLPNPAPRRFFVALAIGGAAAGLAFLFGQTPLAERFEHASYDLRVRQTARPVSAESNSSIAIVHINESTLRALEPIFGRWPWPRVVHAQAIDFFTRSGARVVAYDVLFAENDTKGAITLGNGTLTGTESDAELVAAVRRAGNVVFIADATFETPDIDPPTLPLPAYSPGPGFQNRPSLKTPFADLKDAALAIGHSLLVHDADGAGRRLLPFINVNGVHVPSLGLAAVLAGERVREADVKIKPQGDALRIGSREMPLLADPVPPVIAGDVAKPSRQVLLNFRRPVTDKDSVTMTYPVYSFFDVLLSEERAAAGQPPPIDPAAFKDKFVFVGLTAAGTFEMFATPFGSAGAPGIELHATLADNVLTGQFMRRASRRLDGGVTIGVGLVAGLLATFLPVSWATAAILTILAALGVLLTRQVSSGLWVAAVAPTVAASLSLFGGVAWQYVVEGRAKRHIKGLFGRYVSKDVIDQLMTDPALARLGGQRREMTVLFSDIRGFTSASERSVPEEVVRQLNEYFTAMVEVLFRHQGTLDKFVGDMVMGLFGAPLTDPRHADHAVAAALEMTAVLDRLNAAWKAEGRPRLDIGIGVNSGEMIAGNIGSDTIMSYTVIGDAVNLGARLESLNKEYGTRILISQATLDRLTSPVKTRRIDEVTVKGKTQPVVVHEVLGRT